MTLDVVRYEPEKAEWSSDSGINRRLGAEIMQLIANICQNIEYVANGVLP
jgi:hypothetical protein